MVIKIDPANPGGIERANGSRQSTERITEDQNTPKADEPGRDSGNVRLTSEAQHAAAAERALANTPVVDKARVEAIKAAIQNGQYTVDAQRIADKILLLERDL